MKYVRGIVSLLAVSLLLAAGLTAEDKDKNKNKNRSGGQAEYGADQSTNRIAREVRHELVMLPYYGVFDNLSYRVDGNTVTLLGQVTRPTLKSDAGRVVKSVEGVETVKTRSKC